MIAVDKIVEGLRTANSPWVGVLEATRKVLQMHERETAATSEVTQ